MPFWGKGYRFTTLLIFLLPVLFLAEIHASAGSDSASGKLAASHNGTTGSDTTAGALTAERRRPQLSIVIPKKEGNIDGRRFDDFKDGKKKNTHEKGELLSKIREASTALKEQQTGLDTTLRQLKQAAAPPALYPLDKVTVLPSKTVNLDFVDIEVTVKSFHQTSNDVKMFTIVFTSGKFPKDSPRTLSFSEIWKQVHTQQPDSQYVNILHSIKLCTHMTCTCGEAYKVSTGSEQGERIHPYYWHTGAHLVFGLEFAFNPQRHEYEFRTPFAHLELPPLLH